MHFFIRIIKLSSFSNLSRKYPFGGYFQSFPVHSHLDIWYWHCQVMVNICLFFFILFFCFFFLEIMIVILWAHPISSLWLPKHAHTIRVFFTFSITTSVWRPEHVRSIVFFLFVIGASMFFFFTSAIDTSSRQYEHPNLNILLLLFEKTSCLEKQWTDYLTWQSFFVSRKFVGVSEVWL